MWTAMAVAVDMIAVQGITGHECREQHIVAEACGYVKAWWCEDDEWRGNCNAHYRALYTAICTALPLRLKPLHLDIHAYKWHMTPNNSFLR
jgi:hypothetical protein